MTSDTAGAAYPAVAGAETVIETARLRLRPHRDADLADLVELAAPWAIASWLTTLPHPYTDEHGREWITHVRRSHAAGQPRSFAVALRHTDRLIGGAGLDGTGGTDMDAPALGYWFSTPHHGHGYAREAVSAVIDYGFRILGLQDIDAVTDPGNASSQRVLLACGLRCVGEVGFAQPTRHGAHRGPLYRISRNSRAIGIP